MPQEPRSERTERPTGRKLKKAREQGKVPRSSEVSGAVVLGAFLVFAHVFGPAWLDRLEGLMAETMGGLHRGELTPNSLLELFRATGWTAALLLAPPLGMLAAAGVAGNLIQGPPPFTLHPFKPTFQKLNPVNGIKKVFSLRQWVEVLKSLVKMALYGSVGFYAARDAVLNGTATSPGPEGAFLMLVALAAKVIFLVTLVVVGLAVLDYMFRRYDYIRDLRMTKKEVKDERKETEGDPAVRSRIRQKQMTMSRSRMMADVPKATVVVTNPTQIAVALRYRPGEDDVPILLAKGRALLADRIREIAVAHGIPVVSDPPLARALYRSVPVGARIPTALFRAVAEVLALVFSRRRRHERPEREAGPEESRP